MSVSFCRQKPTTWWSLRTHKKKKNILIFLSLSNIIYKLQSTKQVAKNQVITKSHTGLTSTTVLHPNLTNFPLILCLLLLRLSSSESESDSLIKFDTQSTSSNHIIKPFFFFFNLIFNTKSKNTNPTTYFYFLKKYIYFFIFNNRKDTLILYLSDPHKATTLKCFSLLSLLLQNLTLKFSLSFLFKNRDWFLNKFLSVGPYDLIDNIYH